MTWEFFSVQELRCKGTNEINMDEKFMQKLEALRKELNQPMIITSGYRHIGYNQVIGGSRNSPHLYGKAVDVLCYGKDAYTLISMAMQSGMTGIGVQQRGDYDSRFIHLDDMPKSKSHHRPWIWSYK